MITLLRMGNEHLYVALVPSCRVEPLNPTLAEIEVLFEACSGRECLLSSGRDRRLDPAAGAARCP